MLPNEKGKVTDTSRASTIGYSRAYTFLDSYIYSRNGKYNALYQKNKEILSMEKEAIERENAEALYAAATEQAQALNSVLVRVRNFAQECRRDVIRNLELILPDKDELDEFDEALGSISNIPKMKVLKYQILPIVYPNMAVFLALFRKELSEFIAIDDETSNRSDPFPHNVASKFLIDTTEKYAASDVGILGKESLELANKQELVRINNYFKRKQTILNIVVKDFRTFYIYLRQYNALDRINDMMKPTVMADGSVKVGTIGTVKTFHDYLVIYKHYTMMIKCLMDAIANFDAKFFNKIYAIQSNIECYRSIMNNVVTIYKTRARNIDESFNDMAGTIGGPEVAVQFLNDDAADEDNNLEDRIEGLEIKDSISDEMDDIFEDTYDKDPNVNEVYDEYKDKEVSGSVGTAYHDPRKYMSVMNPESRAEDSLLAIYDSTKINDLRYNKGQVLKEAADEKKSYKEILKNIENSIVSANDNFKNSAAEIHKQYGDIHEKCKEIDIQSYDLSGVHFEMYNFPKGVDLMHHIRIPSFREADSGILLVDNGVNYKHKYFEDLYYFHQNETPINITRFRGSLAKKPVQDHDAAKMFAWFINYIESYDKVINAVSHANARIKSAINRGIQLFDLAYGGDNDQLTEAILINRSQFRNDLFSILLEAEGEEPAQEGQQPEKLNIDDAAAKSANDSNQLYKAIINYVKITNEINSTRMLMYETVLTNAFEYLKLIMDSIKVGNAEESMETAPAQEAPEQAQQVQKQEAQPQQVEQQPQEQQPTNK